MVLHGHNGKFFVPDAFHCLVVQVDRDHFGILADRVLVDGKHMVLGSDFNFTRAQVDHWLVAAVMAEPEFECFSAQGDV